LENKCPKREKCSDKEGVKETFKVLTDDYDKVGGEVLSYSWSLHPNHINKPIRQRWEHLKNVLGNLDVGPYLFDY